MARLFTRASSHYLETAAAVGGTYPFTMCCWFRSVTITEEQTLMSIGDTAGDDNIHSLKAAGHVAGDPVRAETRANSTRIALTSTGYSADTWHLATGVWAAGNDRRAFIDGGSKGTNTVNRNPSGLDTTAIGRETKATPSDYMDGDLGEAIIWDVALSDAEVARLPHVPLWTVRPKDVVGYWPVWGLHSAEIDLSGNGNHMTVTGATKSNHAPVTLFTSNWAASVPLIETAAGGGFAHSQAVIFA